MSEARFSQIRCYSQIFLGTQIAQWTFLSVKGVLMTKVQCITPRQIVSYLVGILNPNPWTLNPLRNMVGLEKRTCTRHRPLEDSNGDQFWVELSESRGGRAIDAAERGMATLAGITYSPCTSYLSSRANPQT